MPNLNYISNPILSRFHLSKAFVRGVMGPYRSGKSVGMCLEMFKKSIEQKPGADGVRRTRWVIVRSTYPELRSTTIATWQAWFPERICPIVYSAPITGHMIVPLSDGTRADITLWFLALDRPEDASSIGGLEVTGAWINEARDIDKVIINTLCARVGQFPAVKDGGCTWSGVIMDTNPPDDSHWWYKMFEEVHPQGWEMFRQPPAVLRDPKVVGRWHANPNAENLQNLNGGSNYYEKLIESSTEDWIKVYLAGEYGATFSGKPVWHEYNDLIHVAPGPLKPIRGLPIQLGWDYGLTPSCVIAQLTARGQMLVFEEMAAQELGIRGFITNVVKPSLVQKWNGFTIRSMGDPAGEQRSQADERTCFDELNAAGIPTEPAPTNAFAARRECVAGFLSRMVDGQPGFLLDPGCKNLRKALNGAYHFERIQTMQKNGEALYKDAPAKNMYSHVSDALQYAALALDPVLNVKRRCRAVVPRGVTAKGWV